MGEQYWIISMNAISQGYLDNYLFVNLSITPNLSLKMHILFYLSRLSNSQVELYLLQQVKVSKEKVLSDNLLTASLVLVCLYLILYYCF